MVYSDASEKAIAAVAYLRVEPEKRNTETGFIMGKVKMAPNHGHTIPRLELCAAVLAVEIGDVVCESLDTAPTSVLYHTDSRIVLGYLQNQTKRFSVYISNRVSRVLKSSHPQQWRYIATQENPADKGTRSLPAAQITESLWLRGPPVRTIGATCLDSGEFVEPDSELYEEQSPEVIVHKTMVKSPFNFIGPHIFERFSTWKSLVSGVAQLKYLARHKFMRGPVSVRTYMDSENFIIQQIQQEKFAVDIECLKSKGYLSKNSPLLTLDPFLDDNGLLRVGGRLNKTKFSSACKNPVIIPQNHHVATLLVRHYHVKIHHQGRHITEGAVRSAGFWIIGGKRLISSTIYKCVVCRKLRGKVAYPKMADLPFNRLEPSPPFTYVGVDTFGPWSVVARRTRGGHANSKRWAVLFTCMVCRAIHIEVVEDLSASAFINALRRFVAIRGNVKQFRSDRGTNFVGSVESLNFTAVNVEEPRIRKFLRENKSEWTFNPPYSSHMGGVWERMIGVSRRILDSMLNGVSAKNLTHDMLVTLMAEVCAIVNGRPIIPVSSDPESPAILSPSSLLTLKTEPVNGLDQTLSLKDIYKSQWRRVQALADNFWCRWRTEYLQTLQHRRKWQKDERNLQQGDLVLLKDKDTHRNQWPMGIVMDAIPSDDGRTRKATVRVYKGDKTVIYSFC